MDHTNLASRECKPCRGDETPLKGEALEELSDQLGQDWKVVGEDHIEREYELDDFQAALDFTNSVGTIAEKEGHHPDIELGWGRVQLNLKTHEIDGLSENDFILAAKADEAFEKQGSS